MLRVAVCKRTIQTLGREILRRILERDSSKNNINIRERFFKVYNHWREILQRTIKTLERFFTKTTIKNTRERFFKEQYKH